MAQISFDMLDPVLDVANQPRWRWIVDGEDCVFADKGFAQKV